MTAIIDRDGITAVQEAATEAQALVRHGSAAAGRRAATRARGVSPRLARSRSQDPSAASITSSNELFASRVRTESAEIRVTGARGAARRTVERPGVRSAVRRAPAATRAPTVAPVVRPRRRWRSASCSRSASSPACWCSSADPRPPSRYRRRRSPA